MADDMSRLNEFIKNVQINSSNDKASNAYLHSIDQSLKQIARGMSQSAAKEHVFSSKGVFAERYNSFGSEGSTSRKLGSFTDEFEKQLLDAFLGSDFKKNLGKSFDGLAKQLGVDVNQIAGKLGQELGRRVVNKTGLDKAFAKSMTKVSGATTKAMGTLGQWGAGAATTGELVASFGSVAAAAAPMALAFLAVDKALDALAPSIEGVKKLFAAAGKAANRYETSRQKNLELQKQRLADDVRSMIEAPFNILKDAANAVYQAWDNNVRVINGTQGYTKADLQSLMGAFAERLRDEGLSSVIGANSVTEQLAKVLQSGLSGKVAEEFAYQAIKLNAAIPTQDFFGYAATYSSIAANAVRQGKSQDQAIKEATKSLYEFSNNVLYASRELAGGFSTGLTNASNLYEQATKIVQASKTGDVNQISGVLTAVSGIVGAIAPDLASSLTDAVYSAAVGGNSNNLVALRSLAGINASNTEFLRALATDPKKVYSTIFRNLAAMYASGGNAYMEKAEGYSELFGLSMEAFQRIDFEYLSKAISQMNTSSTSLDDNMALLQSGQTTQTKEQQRIAEINKTLIEEGLAYVLDNDVARSIQEHMWAEQIAREQMEATYGVELRGAAMEALSGLMTTVQKILNFLNPFKWFQKIDNVLKTNEEGKALERDIASLLNAGKVGQGNGRSFYNLTTRGKALQLAPNILSYFGADSAYATAQSNRISGFKAGVDRFGLGLEDLAYRYNYGGAYSGGSTARGSVASLYRWGSLGKSRASSAQSYLRGRGSRTGSGSILSASGSSPLNSLSNAVEAMLASAYLDKYIDEGGYDAWKASAKSRGIADFDAALESAGYSESQVRDYFQTKQTEKGWQAQDEIRKHEQKFRETGIQFWETDFWERYHSPLEALLNEQFTAVTDNQKLMMRVFGFTEDQPFKTWISEKYLQGHLAKWWDTYKRYYIDHAIYSGGQLKLSKLEEIQNKEKKGKGDVVNALAEFLTTNKWNLEDLKDPQVQTNALLSQILIVINAIMNQNNTVAGTVSLADSISALAMGGLTKTEK